MPDGDFASPDVTTSRRLDEHGLRVTGQRFAPDRAVLSCLIAAEDPWCCRCGAEGVACGNVVRELVHGPLGWRPTTLQVRVWRSRCRACERGRGTGREADSWRARLGAGGSGGRALVDGSDRAGAGVAWHTTNTAVLASGTELLINDPRRFDGVHVLGSTSTYDGTRPRLKVRHGHHRPDPGACWHRGQHGCWTWSKHAPGRSSGPGSPATRRPGATGCRWWRWTDSPDSRPPWPRNCPRPSRSWTRSMSSAWPGMPGPEPSPHPQRPARASRPRRRLAPQGASNATNLH